MALLATLFNLALILVGLYGGSLGAILASRKGSLSAGLIGTGILLLVTHTLLDFMRLRPPSAASAGLKLLAVLVLTAAIHRLWAGAEAVTDAEPNVGRRRASSAAQDEAADASQRPETPSPAAMQDETADEAERRDGEPSVVPGRETGETHPRDP